MTTKTLCPKPYEAQQKYSKTEVYSNSISPQETRKISSENLILHLRQLQKKEHRKFKVSRMKEIIHIRAEIN